MDTVPHFIAGSKVHRQGAHETADVFNPATGQVARKVCLGGAAEVVAAAKAASDGSPTNSQLSFPPLSA